MNTNLLSGNPYEITAGSLEAIQIGKDEDYFLLARD
jgi:hypothetical protein